jgi:hypothetical protein
MSDTPSAGDLGKGQEVAAAAAAAIAEEKTPAAAQAAAEKAIAAKAQQVKLEITDEDASKIAKMLVAELDALGAFDPPPPAAPAAVTAETPAGAGPDAPAPPAELSTPPAKKTFAEKFAGV